MTCDRCPCAWVCVGHKVYCCWAVEVPPDPVKLRHICGASAIYRDPPVRTIPLEESIRLTKSAKLCPFRSAGGCGCSAAKCALRAGALVSHQQCFDCLRTYG